MSYSSLGEICGATKNGAPFSDKTKLILISNFGGASYSSTKINGQIKDRQFDGRETLADAYRTQFNPYASSLSCKK